MTLNEYMKKVFGDVQRALPPPLHNAAFETHPTHDDAMRWADDGGRIPENDRLKPITVGAILRIRLPSGYRVTQ